MKTSIQDKIKSMERLIRLCNGISIAGVVVTVALLCVEFFVAGALGSWKKDVLQVCIYVLYVMPFVITIPLFFRVNLKGKLYRLNQKKEEKQHQNV